MNILECRARLSPTLGSSLALLLVFAAAVVAASFTATRANAAPPEASAKFATQAAKPVVIGSPLATKQTAARSKLRPRVAPRSAKPVAAAAAKESAANPASEATAKPTPAPTAKATQVMDFDPDQVEGQRLEPGFELIEGAPRRARQPSLVPPPSKPEDSVVKGN